MAYSIKHKQFLQHFMRERIVSERDAKKINNILFPDNLLDNTIELINGKIAPLELKINKSVCEQNGDINYVFICNFSDNDFKVKPDPRKEIFKQLVNYIFEKDGSVSYDEAIMFNNHMSDTMMTTFFTNKYLVADKDNNIFLSALALNELEGYLVQLFHEKKCVSCMSIVSHGIKCPSCAHYVHGHCLTKYFKNIEKKKCPRCSTQLSVEWRPIEVVNKY